MEEKRYPRVRMKEKTKVKIVKRDWPEQIWYIKQFPIIKLICQNINIYAQIGEIGCRKKKCTQICENFLYINTDIAVYWGKTNYW